VYWIVAPPALPLRSSCGNSTGGAAVTALGPNLHRVRVASRTVRMGASPLQLPNALRQSY
jgi:hypothetical protein